MPDREKGCSTPCIQKQPGKEDGLSLHGWAHHRREWILVQEMWVNAPGLSLTQRVDGEIGRALKASMTWQASDAWRGDSTDDKGFNALTPANSSPIHR